MAPGLFIVAVWDCPGTAAFTRVGNFAGDDPGSPGSPYSWFEADVPFRITGNEPLGVS
jgi:hypothetical protein